MRITGPSLVIASIVALSSTAGFTFAQTLAASQPNPPGQVCVNQQCVSTGGGGPIKWNPGHYMASDAIFSLGKNLSYLQQEMDDINNHDAVLGYRAWFTWGALEPTQGNYDFSVVDAVLARLKTAYNKPKRLVIGLWLYSGGSWSPNNPGNAVPLYIQQNSMYGASPVNGSYGWWGFNNNGASTGMYAPALYNPVVMNRLIALVQALGAHLDAEPYFEGLTIQEDASISQAAQGNGHPDPAYSDSAFLVQLERLLSAATAAFPHTSVIEQNSWFRLPQPAVALEQWMNSNRIAPGSADTVGQSAINTYGTGFISDGLQTMIGVDGNGGTTDLRPKMRAMMEIQMPDMVGGYYTNQGGPYMALDLVNALNTTYQASHAFWTHLFGTENYRGQPVPAPNKWSNLVVTISQNPLTHTSYPGNYP